MQQHTDMLQSINIQDMLLLFLFGAAIAMLGMAFQAFMLPGQIFNWWAIFLLKCISKAETGREAKVEIKNKCGRVISQSIVKLNAKWYYIIITKLSKPLGLCPYCNTTWIAIILFLIYFKLSFNILLLMGITWFFVKAIMKLTQEN